MCFTRAEIHNPKVHEDPKEHDHVRSVRNPNDHVSREIHRPPVFDYKSALQQDHQKNRYALQQQADLVNLPGLKDQTGISHILSHDNLQQQSGLRLRGQNNGKRRPTVKLEEKRAVPSFEEAEDWQPMIPRHMRSEQRSDEEIMKNNLELMKVNAPKETGLKADKEIRRSNKKLKQSSYFAKEDDLQTESTQTTKVLINRQDHLDTPGQSQYIYIQPNILKNNFGIDGKDAEKILKNVSPNLQKYDRNYSVLKDLIGKNPNVQLEGLKKLLERTNSNAIFPVVQGAQPFKPSILQHTPEPNNHDQIINQIPNVEHSNSKSILEALQAQLDASSKEQASNVLAQAHQQALAHVEAQHKAIALAAERAKQEAFAKIAAQNGGFNQPQALPLTAPAPQQVQAHNVVVVSPITPINYKNRVAQTYVSSTEPSYNAITQQPPTDHDAYSAQQVAPQQTYDVQHESLATNTVQIGGQSNNAEDHDTEQSKNTAIPAPISYSKPLSFQSTKPDVQLYAPNHNHHQLLALLQAEKVVASQIKKQNEALIDAQTHKEAARQNGLLLHQGTENHKTVELQIHQNIDRPAVPNTSYQEVVMETEHKTENKIYARSKNHRDEHNDVSKVYTKLIGLLINVLVPGRKFSDLDKHVINKRELNTSYSSDCGDYGECNGTCCNYDEDYDYVTSSENNTGVVNFDYNYDYGDYFDGSSTTSSVEKSNQSSNFNNTAPEYELLDNLQPQERKWRPNKRNKPRPRPQHYFYTTESPKNNLFHHYDVHDTLKKQSEKGAANIIVINNHNENHESSKGGHIFRQRPHNGHKLKSSRHYYRRKRISKKRLREINFKIHKVLSKIGK